MKKLFAILFSLILIGCTEDKKETKVNSHEVIPGFKATQYMDIYFAGQPTDENFAELKKAGFASVINLRQATEGSYTEAKEKEAVEKASLIYTHIPMSGSEELTDELISKITSAIMKNRKLGKTLVHCGSGNRAAYWAGGHFFKDHKFSKEESMSVAKSLGLTSSKLTDKLEDYLSKK